MNDKPSDRPDPDALLTEVRQREKKSRQGSLKVFFGMCAGVGKTYAMLQEAQALGREGRKILVGNVETHGRPETEALLEGLVTVPRRTLTYRDVTLTEFDLDAVLQQRPDIVLVDELAHHNAPGSRHPKRYQDVEELLDRGISVYTTLNVQHLESRAKTVEDITGAPVRETVPDSFLEHDGEIELVDISPQELRKRLSDGKVYTPEGAKSALQHFFRPGNLTALREMALRVTAEHVDKQMRDSMRRERIPGPWKAGERLMVAVGSSPFSASLIAWTRRMAATMNASWIAVNVETPARLSINQTAQLAGNLRLAQELGAEILTVHASDTVEGLLHAAGQHNITQIVVGKSARGHLVEWLRGGSLVDRLIRRSGNIDIYVVRGDVIHENSKRVPPWPLVSGWRQYGAALAAVAAAVLALLTVVSFINYTAVGMFLLFMITLLSLWLGRGPVLFGAALSALLWNILFIPPRFTFHIARTEDTLIFCMYFIIAAVTGALTTKIRGQEEAVRKREARAMALLSVSRALAMADSTDAIARAAVTQIARFFGADVALFFSVDKKQTLHPASTFCASEKEGQVAAWAAENRKAAGAFTNNLPLAQAHYEPLATPRDVYGAMGVRFHRETVFTLDQETLLDHFAGQIAAAIERERFNKQRHRAEMDDASERLYKTLLHSISHEFRTPLSVISGAANSLLEQTLPLSDASRRALLEETVDASDRLNSLVENLLNMSRLDAGRIHPKKEWSDLIDLFSALQRRFKRDSGRHPIAFVPDPDLPLVLTDAGLLEQAMVNLVQNAVQHTPEGTPVEVRAFLSGRELVVTVRDKGPGFPEEAFQHLFEKFYRVPGTAPGGTGLGLSIAKGLIESLRGVLSAENEPKGGALFTLRLPVETKSTELGTEHGPSRKNPRHR